MTSSPRWERVEEIFHGAREQPPDNRSDFLHAACEGDVQLRRIVEALLEEDHASDTLRRHGMCRTPDDYAGAGHNAWSISDRERCRNRRHGPSLQGEGFAIEA